MKKPLDLVIRNTKSTPRTSEE